jgi:hypothetical protein
MLQIHRCEAVTATRPFRPIADDDFLFRSAPTAPPGFQIEAFAKVFGRFNGAHIGSRIGIADGIAFLVPSRLREHAAQLGLPRVGGLPGDLARAAHGFLLDDRHSRAIHLHVEDRHRLAHNQGQIQLHGALDRVLFPGGDIPADGFRRALYRFAGYLQASQKFHLLASLIEGRILAYDCLHAAYSRREFAVFDVQFGIGGAPAGVAVRAQVVGTRDFHRANGGQNPLGAQLPVMSLLAASTRNNPLRGGRSGELQQFAQRARSRLLHGRAYRHLDSFQIEMAGLWAALEDQAQQLVYFPPDLLLDRVRRFFSCGDSVSSIGRTRQIFSFTSRNS